MSISFRFLRSRPRFPAWPPDRHGGWVKVAVVLADDALPNWTLRPDGTVDITLQFVVSDGPSGSVTEPLRVCMDDQ